MPTESEKVHHPLFARLFVRINQQGEARGRVEHRRELLRGLAGRVVEVGAGDGLNFAHYPSTVSEVVAVEPEPYLRQRAEAVGASASVAVQVVDGLAERVPASDAAFDAGVVSSVLCSVLDPERALAELFRVIKPGGGLRFYEHIRADTGGFERPRLARLQRALDATVWPRIGGGCHLSRDTLAAIQAAGFRVERVRRLWFTPSPVTAVAAPHIIGLARRP